MPDCDAAIMLVSGLWYTQVWGQGLKYIAKQFGQQAFVVPPRSAIPKTSERKKGEPLQLDAAVATMKELYPDGSYFIGLPKKPDDGFFVTVQGDSGPSTWAVLVLDPSNGKVLTHRKTSELGVMDWWTRWNYPLHVGSVLGTPSKVVWLLVTIVLTALPITGVWMWWKRKPKGSWGAPARIKGTTVPRWLKVAIVALGLLLPTFGASVLVLIAGDWCLRRWQMRRAPAIA